MNLADGAGKGPHRSIAQPGGMTFVEAVGQAEHELQLGAELEKRQIEVAPHTCLKIDIIALELQDVIVSPAEVDDGAQSCHEVRPVVSRTLRRIDNVCRTGDIDTLQVLRAAAKAVGRLRIIVSESDMPAAKIECRGKTEREIIVQARLTEHTYVEAIVPLVLVRRDGVRLHGAIIKRNGLRSDIEQFHILHVRPHEDAEVERPQISIRPVLHRAVLRIGTSTEQCGENEAKKALHANNNADSYLIIV